MRGALTALTCLACAPAGQPAAAAVELDAGMCPWGEAETEAEPELKARRYPRLEGTWRGRATLYYAGDGTSGSHAGCFGWAKREYGTNRLGEIHDLGVPYLAHRTLPCGAEVALCLDGCAVGIVVDRGPYGQDCPEDYVGTVAHLLPGCTWRGEWDVSPAVAGPIGLHGRGYVTAQRLTPPRAP